MGFYSFTQLLIDLRRAIQIRGHVLRERVLVGLLGLVVAIEDEVALAFDVLGPEVDRGPTPMAMQDLEGAGRSRACGDGVTHSGSVLEGLVQ